MFMHDLIDFVSNRVVLYYLLNLIPFWLCSVDQNVCLTINTFLVIFLVE